jgi:hypothetical protein
MTDSPPPSPYNPYDPSSSEYEPPTTKYGPPQQPQSEPSEPDEDQPTAKFAPPQQPQQPSYGQPAQPTTYGGQPPAYGQSPQATPYGQQPPAPSWGQPQPPQQPEYGQPQQPGYGQPQQPYGAGQAYPPQSAPPATPYPTSGAPNQDGGYGVYPPQSSPPGPDPYAGYPQQGQPGYPQQGYPQPGQPGYPQQGYPQPGMPGGAFPPVPPKKSNRTLIITLISIGVVLLLAGCAAACWGPFALVNGARESLENSGAYDPPQSSSSSSAGAGSETDRSGSGDTVVYEVTGTGQAILSYTDGAGSPVSRSGVKLPWKQEVKVPSNRAKILTAARSGGGSGDITCKITVNGETVVTKSGSGEFGVVTCTRFSTG